MQNPPKKHGQRECPWVNDDGSKCAGRQFYKDTARPPEWYSEKQDPRPGWECSIEPTHFDDPPEEGRKPIN